MTRTLMALAMLAGAVFSWADSEAEPYRLGVDDVICIRVLYHPDFSVDRATVRPDGMVNVPTAGDVQAAGRTVGEVADEIARALEGELRDPQVSVQLLERHLTPVYVLGGVRDPGAVEVREPVTIAEAIALAGGLTEGLAARWATIIEAGGSRRRVDLREAMQGSDASVAPGETLLVSMQFLVTVSGQVAHPGRYPAEDGDTVADLLAAAGGPTDGAADVVRLIRGDGTTQEITIEPGALLADNPRLAAGDRLVVPEARRWVTVVGAVRQPGRYQYEESERVSHAIALAGGTAEDARPERAVLVRADGTSLGVDCEALMQGEPIDDPLLADGDLLIVPRQIDRVAVIGMVADPGPVDLEPAMTLLDAIAAAGGWVDPGAEPSRTILWRTTEEGPRLRFIDAQALMVGGSDTNPSLKPGDIIFVPSDSAISRDEATRMMLGISGLLRLVF